MTEPDRIPDADWWSAVGAAGRTEVSYLTSDERDDVFAGRIDPPVSLEGACADRKIVIELGSDLLRVRTPDPASPNIAEIPPLHPGGMVLGWPLRAELREDPARSRLLLGSHRYWQLTAGDNEWRWEYSDERSTTATLSTHGGVVAHSTVHPARIGGHSASRLTTGWEATARPVDVLIAQMVPLAGWERSVWNRVQRALHRGLGAAVVVAEELAVGQFTPRRAVSPTFRRQRSDSAGTRPAQDLCEADRVTERAVAVVRNGTRLLVIHRRRDDRSYCVLPGGGVEPGEEPSTAALRELAEETGLRGTVRGLLYRDETDRPATYFVVDVDDPDAELVIGGPERERTTSTNTYRPGWIELTELEHHNLQPARLRRVLEEPG